MNISFFFPLFFSLFFFLFALLFSFCSSFFFSSFFFLFFLLFYFLSFLFFSFWALRGPSGPPLICPPGTPGPPKGPGPLTQSGLSYPMCAPDSTAICKKALQTDEPTEGRIDTPCYREMGWKDEHICGSGFAVKTVFKSLKALLLG